MNTTSVHMYGIQNKIQVKYIKQSILTQNMLTCFIILN